MKNMKISLLFLVFMLLLGSKNSYSQSGWTWQNPSVNGNSLWSFKMVNDNTGFACGNAGTVIKTTNNGTSWKTLNTGTSTQLSSITAVDINIVYASGINGKILKSIDGGNSWESLTTGTTSRLNTIQFLNTNTGYASGESGTIIKTTDAGQTWALQSSNTQTFLFAMYFIDENTGYASGNIAIVTKTTDGGITWNLMPQIQGGQATRSLYFTDTNTGFAGNALGQVFKTTDGGNSWSMQQLDTQYGSFIESIQFTDNLTGYACGGSDQWDKKCIYKTSDAGSSWVEQMYTFGPPLSSINFSNPLNGIAVGQNGQAFLTINGGANWVSLKNSAIDLTLTKIYFPTIDTGYAVAYGSVVKTTNGGVNWIQLNHPAPNNQCDGVYFINGSTGVIGGESNNIWRTTNGGTNWTATQPDNFSLYHEFEFTSPTTGYTAGAQGKISKTTDAGVTWQGQTATSTTWDFKDIKFVNKDTGIAVGIQGLIVKTTNGGVNWITKTSPVVNNFSGVDFSGNIGILVTENFGQIFRSTNLGETWIEITSPTSIGLTSVAFTSPTTAFITGWTGKILKSTDAGLTWNIINSSTSTNIEDIFIAQNGSAYVVGQGGMILHMDDAGTLVNGTVRYQDNNQTVGSGRVMALRLNSNNEVVVLGSSPIAANGTYNISNLPALECYIVAYPNSDLDFVPTYYPSTVDWENAVRITPTGSVSNINVNVYRITNSPNNGSLGGGVFKHQISQISNDTNVIDYAVVYAKQGGIYKSFSSSISNGDYGMHNLNLGTYEIHASRLGYANQTFQRTLNILNDSINIYMIPGVTGISGNGSNVPTGYELKQNYPNPFNPTTKIEYNLPVSGLVKLNIYDITGRQIATLVNTIQNAGQYTIRFDGSNLSSGIYFYSIESNGFNSTKKMMLIK
ncbi:hypothetical protein BH10BAC5_BH10BAC5_13560 [soil metagenome]